MGRLLAGGFSISDGNYMMAGGWHCRQGFPPPGVGNGLFVAHRSKTGRFPFVVPEAEIPVTTPKAAILAFATSRSLHLVRIDGITSKGADLGIRVNGFLGQHDECPDRHRSPTIPELSIVPEITAALMAEYTALPGEIGIDGEPPQSALVVSVDAFPFYRQGEAKLGIIRGTDHDFILVCSFSAGIHRKFLVRIFDYLFRRHLRSKCSRPKHDQ